MDKLGLMKGLVLRREVVNRWEGWMLRAWFSRREVEGVNRWKVKGWVRFLSEVGQGDMNGWELVRLALWLMMRWASWPTAWDLTFKQSNRFPIGDGTSRHRSERGCEKRDT